MIPPKIADGSLSSGRSHPPSAYARSALVTSESSPEKAYLQLASVPRVLPYNTVDERNNAAYKYADKGESSNAGRPAAFFLEDNWECAKEELYSSKSVQAV